MRNAKWLAGLVLVCANVGVAMAVDAVPLPEPVAGSHESSTAQEHALQKTQQVQTAPQAKTREQVKRELAAARASGCMDVPDSQYPQPCPLPEGTRSVAEAFQMQ